jgi:CO dehydrogenase/acetyl-CoA synthase beta subunit
MKTPLTHGETMPTNEELHAADKRHEEAINAIKASLREQGVLIERHDLHLRRLDEIVTEIRDSVATKDDINGLREDLRSREALHERLDHYRDRLAEMEDAGSERREDEKHEQGMTINRIVVGLFLGELAIAAMQLWFMVRHG